ncbi:unnamed protein product [Alternaria alternata]
MFRRSFNSSSDRERTTINDLPDELLLNIGAHFTNLNRNRDLRNLALTSKKWKPIAQEWLLIEPRFNLTFIDGYMWEMGHRSHLLSRVKKLEIWSCSEGRTSKTRHVNRIGVYVYLTDVIYNPTPAPDRITQQAEFMEICKTMIQQYAANKRHAKDWINCIKTDVVPALFGILLCILPNLLLEVPSDMAALVWEHNVITLFDFRRFETLKEVTLTMRAIEGHTIARQGTPNANPREIFPRTLETLRISEATHITANFLNDLCLAKKAFCFPNLKRVEAYHIEYLENTRARADLARCLDPIDDVRAMFRDAEVAVYLYFPPWTMKTWESGSGTPWRMKSESDRLRRGEYTCYRKAMGPFGVHQEPMDRIEIEWDAEGDAVML